MTRKNDAIIPDLYADPFGEHSKMMARDDLQLLGSRFQFESNSAQLLRLVDSAYAGLPSHRLTAQTPRLRVRLLLTSNEERPPRTRSAPPPLSMLSGAGLLCGTAGSSNFVILSPPQRSALVAVSRELLRFPYHVRYEFIEFAAFTLASRSQKLVSLHAACVGRAGRGILLMGPSGSGKSTVTLQCLLRGFDILSEDSVFIEPNKLLATGVANFLHVRSESLRWLERARDADLIRRSPVIRRRSGVKKFEIDLRRGPYELAASPLKVAAVVFLSPENARGQPLLRRLSKSSLLEKLAEAQAYAVNQPEWGRFSKNLLRIDAFELRRGHHPLETVDILNTLLEPSRV
jgi:hypothetical protein